MPDQLHRRAFITLLGCAVARAARGAGASAGLFQRILTIV
jgi:hypothetical protein